MLYLDAVFYLEKKEHGAGYVPVFKAKRCARESVQTYKPQQILTHLLQNNSYSVGNENHRTVRTSCFYGTFRLGVTILPPETDHFPGAK